MRTMLCVLSLIVVGCATTPQSSNDTPDQILTGVKGITLTVYGMSCPLCANNLDGQLMRIDGIESADIDLDTGAITVLFDGDIEITERQIARAVENAGFSLRNIDVLAEEEK